jgi:hypothetical protein
MLKQRLLDARQQFEHVRNILIGSNRARENDVPCGGDSALCFTGNIDRAYWKAFDHCAALVRCYATFERFILDTVATWLQWCLLHYPERVLQSSAAREAYEAGFAEILRRKSDPRFSDLDRGKLAGGLALFYSDVAPEKLTLPADPFFASLPNLRLQHIVDLFRNVALGDPSDWVGRYAPLRDMREAEGFGVESELRQIVERRNEAAHGNDLPNEILGTNELLSRIEFLEHLCTAIREFVIAQVCRLELGDDYGNALIGVVTHVWPRSEAFELTVSCCSLSVGASVILVGPAACISSAIKSIQLDGEELPQFLGEKGVALGIKMDYLPSEGMRVIDANSVRWLVGSEYASVDVEENGSGS